MKSRVAEIGIPILARYVVVPMMFSGEMESHLTIERKYSKFFCQKYQFPSFCGVSQEKRNMKEDHPICSKLCYHSLMSSDKTLAFLMH
jgi:hypothetical protein